MNIHESESAHELAKLKWQCRRGCLELDLLLSQCLETFQGIATF
jgi:succinate dehydrogenase flavin-adding protein (antitoxin of CptAB toxin-antitoxin module)